MVKIPGFCGSAGSPPLLASPLGCFYISVSRRSIAARLPDEHSTTAFHQAIGAAFVGMPFVIIGHNTVRSLRLMLGIDAGEGQDFIIIIIGDLFANVRTMLCSTFVVSFENQRFEGLRCSGHAWRGVAWLGLASRMRRGGSPTAAWMCRISCVPPRPGRLV